MNRSGGWRCRSSSSRRLFFALGGYFCWAVVFKVGYAFFLAQYATIGVTPTIRISEYLAFSAKLLLAFGLTFEMPIFAFFLTRLGLIDYRMMLQYFRYAVLGIFVVSAALTPPDMVSLFLLAIPLLLLYAAERRRFLHVSRAGQAQRSGGRASCHALSARTAHRTRVQRKAP